MINIPKGTKDVLPANSYKWQFIEDTAREVATLYNLKEVRTPVFEHTELFLRGVGQTTDVVSKEMYTFEDKGGRSITLKPEGTAGVARMFIENSMQGGVLPLKAYYITPCFRYERPQAGRLREFHQFGIEVFGSKNPETDAEVIFAASTFLQKLGVTKVRLSINSIGCRKCRGDYNSVLKAYYAPNLQNMCPTCQARYEKNPLRMLDCKEEKCKQINQNAPKIIDYLCDDCNTHFTKVKSLLDTAQVEYTIDPYIVRGLDYYSKTVFEFVSTAIGSQGTVCGGGRYDTLIEDLGGASVPAVGFGAGIERLLLLMENTEVPFPEENKPIIYFAGMDEETRAKAFALAQELRVNGISAEVDHMGRSLKAQFKYADKLGAVYVAVIGSEELANGACNVKKMVDGSQRIVKFSDLINYLK